MANSKGTWKKGDITVEKCVFYGKVVTKEQMKALMEAEVKKNREAKKKDAKKA